MAPPILGIGVPGLLLPHAKCDESRQVLGSRTAIFHERRLAIPWFCCSHILGYRLSKEFRINQDIIVESLTLGGRALIDYFNYFRQCYVIESEPVSPLIVCLLASWTQARTVRKSTQP